MALLSISGFELGNAVETAASGTHSFVTSPVRNGDYAFRSNPTSANTGYAVLYPAGAGVTAATLYTRFAFRFATAPAANSEEFFRVVHTATSLKLALRLNSSGNILAYASDGTTLLATGSTALAANTWYVIEVMCETGASAAWAVKLDGVAEISGTGANLSTTNASGVAFGKFTNRNSQAVDFFFDDASYDNAAYPTNCDKILRMDANDNGTYSTWINGTGTTYAEVDEVPPNTTDYLTSTGTAGDSHSVNLESASSAGISNALIGAVQAGAYVLRDGGSNGSIQVRIRSGSTDSDSANRTVSAQWSLYRHILELDPADSGAWTTSDLDGVQAGIEERSTNRTRCSWLGAMVAWSAIANNAPTIALNTADEATLSSLPTLEFTGSDTEDDDIRYNIQITDNPASFVGGAVIIDEITTGSGTVIHPNPTGSLDWEGNQQCDDRLGMGFQGQGGILDSVDFRFGTDELGSTDGTYLVRVYEAAGYPVDPVPAAWAASTSYSVGAIVRPTSVANANLHFIYRCKVGGTSGGSEPAWPGNGVNWLTVTELGETTDGTVTWETLAGLHPANPADGDDTPTPGWIAESDSYAFNPIVTTSEFRKCDFTGSDRIRLEVNKWYMAILQWRANSGVYENTINTTNASLANALAPGNAYLDGPGTNNGPRIIEDSWFKVRELFVFLDEVSGTDPGFANTVTPGDTDPFTAGEKISYTVQAGDELDAGPTYRWQARAVDPAGSNLWSDWTAVRTFTVTNSITFAANVAAVTSTPATALAVSRNLSANIHAISTTATPVLEVPGIIIAFSANVQAQAATGAAAAILRPLIANQQAQSATPPAVVSVARSLAASSTAVSATPATMLNALRSLASVIQAQTSTPATSLPVSRPLTAAATAVTTTPSTAVVVARTLASNAQGQSATPAASLPVSRPLTAAATAVATTPSTAVTVARALAGSAQGQSNTPSITLVITGLAQFAANIQAATDTSLPALGVVRPFAANADALSATPDITLSIAGSIQFLSFIQAASDTPDAGLTVLRPFAGGITAVSETAVPDLLKAIALTADIHAASAAEASLFIARLLLPTISPTSTTGAADLSLSIIDGIIVARVSVRALAANVSVQYPAATVQADGAYIVTRLLVYILSASVTVRYPVATVHASGADIVY